jgi:hypothetical protein
MSSRVGDCPANLPDPARWLSDEAEGQRKGNFMPNISSRKELANFGQHLFQSELQESGMTEVVMAYR